MVEFVVFSDSVPTELLAHDLDDARQNLKRGLDVEERNSGSSGDKVDGVHGVLASAGVSRFGLNVGVERGELGTVQWP